MPKVFFKIADMDLTPFVDIQNHEVNRSDVFQNWTDGNWIERRELVRTRIEGTTTVGFSKIADFEAFKTHLAAARHPAGYFPITVYVNNIGEVVQLSAFLTIEGEGKWDLINSRQWITQAIAIMER